MHFKKYDVIHLEEADAMGYDVTFDTYRGYTVATKIRGFYRRMIIITPKKQVYVGSIDNLEINFDSKHQVYNFIDMICQKEVQLNEKTLFPYNDIVKGVTYYDYGYRSEY